MWFNLIKIPYCEVLFVKTTEKAAYFTDDLSLILPIIVPSSDLLSILAQTSGVEQCPPQGARSPNNFLIQDKLIIWIFSGRDSYDNVSPLV